MNIEEYNLSSNILIRCDSSNIIGTGHVMRCLNLCEYFSKNKYTFVCRKFNMNISDKILKANHNLILLDYEIEPIIDDYKTWIGQKIINEVKDLKEILNNNNYDEIIIDHYGIDYIIEEEISKYIKKITVITDIFNFKHCCQEFINYNTDDYQSLKSLNIYKDVKIKCGIEHIIINKIFKENIKNNFNNNIKKIGIMLGGADPKNYTLKILEIINNIVIEKDLEIYIIVGKSNTNINTINNFIYNIKNYKCYYDLTYNELVNLYLNIDLCIGSLSITAYERYFMKLPQICLKIVDNQNIQQLDEFNICILETLLDKLLLLLKKKILILGITGMVGNFLFNYLNNYNTFGTCRNNYKTDHRIFTFDHTENNLELIINKIKPHIIINCIAKLTENNIDDKIDMIETNIILPMIINKLSYKYNIYNINLSSDSIFENKTDIYYDNYAKTNPINFYGYTKLLSEYIKLDYSLIIRFTPVGIDYKKKNLLSWFINNTSNEIIGYSNVFITPITTLEFAKNIDNIINNPIYGIINISSNKVSKFELLNYINNKLNLNKHLIIDKDINQSRCLISNININKSIFEQIDELLIYHNLI